MQQAAKAQPPPNRCLEHRKTDRLPSSKGGLPVRLLFPGCKECRSSKERTRPPRPCLSRRGPISRKKHKFCPIFLHRIAKRPYLCRENLIILRTTTLQANYFNLPATGFCACAVCLLASALCLPASVVYLPASALPNPVAPGGFLPTPHPARLLPRASRPLPPRRSRDRPAAPAFRNFSPRLRPHAPPNSRPPRAQSTASNFTINLINFQ